jgi:hypothetical protein
VTNIAQNFVRVKQFSKRQQAQQNRLELIKLHGFHSEEYLDRLIEDQASFEDEDKEMFNQIMAKLKVDSKIYEMSFEHYVGDESTIDLKFVKSNLELISYHPIKQKTPADPATGRKVYIDALNNTLKRFQEKDTRGQFKSVSAFIHCFDMAVLDMALYSAGFQEEDVRQVTFEQELLESKEA